jgi:hypothetical protein
VQVGPIAAAAGNGKSPYLAESLGKITQHGTLP